MFRFLPPLVLALTIATLGLLAPGPGAALAQSATSESAAITTRHALLVGVNEYQSEDVSDLRGALNDIELAKSVLKNRFGFSEQDIHVLTDEQATREAILGALDRLTIRAKPGDLVYIHFSGHGSQVTDQNGDEVDDGKDETLVPHDGRTPGVPDITDDEVGAMLSRLDAVEALVILDSCHSGTATRSLGVRTRSIPEDTRIGLYSATENTPKNRSVVIRPLSNHVVLTGAASNESALDGPIGGKNRGLFSYALYSVLDAAGPPISIADIHESVKAEFQRISDEFGGMSLPDPQFEVAETRLHRPLFPSFLPDRSSDAAGQPGFVTVMPAGNGQVLLSKGLLTSARGASYWGIYPPGEERFASGGAIAVAKIIAARGQDSIAQLEPATVAVQPGSRAIPISGASPDALIPVDIRADATSKSMLKREILARTRAVKFVTRNDFARFVIEVSRGLCAGCASQIIVNGASGLYELDRFAWGPDGGDRLVRLLSRSRDVSLLKTIANPSSKLKLDIKLVTQPFWEADDRGIKVVSTSAKALYRIKRKGEPRTHKNSLMLELEVSQPSYITIVDIDSEGKTTILFPNDYQSPDFYPQGRVPSGVSVRIPDSLVTPNRAGFHWDYAPPEGEDMIRVFASTDLETAQRIRRYISQIKTFTGRLDSDPARLQSRSAETSWAKRLQQELAQLAVSRGVSVVQASTVEANPPSRPLQDWTAESLNIRVAR